MPGDVVARGDTGPYCSASAVQAEALHAFPRAADLKE
jgi:hypothetical protein